MSSKYIKNAKGDVAIRIYHGHADLGEDTYHQWIMLERTNPIAADTTGKANPRVNERNWIWLCCNNGDCNASAMLHPERVLGAYDLVSTIGSAL